MKKTDLLFLLFISTLFIFYNLGAMTLTTFDEVLYGQSAKEMMLNGVWLTPYLNGEVWFDKPPLYMMVTIFFYKLFGVSEMTARLFSALCGVGSILIIYALGSKLYSRKVGLISAVLLLSSVHFFNYTRLATVDMALSFFILATLYAYCVGGGTFIIMGFALAGALMTKSL